MNQKARQKSTSPAERDFYKLLNNSNFHIDCRNNIENCILEPFYEKICTISGNETYRDFISLIVISEEINEEYSSKIVL